MSHSSVAVIDQIVPPPAPNSYIEALTPSLTTFDWTSLDTSFSRLAERFTGVVACLGNPTDRGAWRATVYGTKERQTRQPPPGLPRKVRKSPCVVHTAANASCPASWRKSVQPPAEGSGTPDRRSWMQAAKGSGITEDSVDVERSNTTSGCRKPRTASGRTEHEGRAKAAEGDPA